MRKHRTNHGELSRLADAEIWQKLKSGDRAALDFIFNQHIEILYVYGSKFSTNVQLVEDCIQDVFLTLWNRRLVLSDTDTIRPYLLTSLRRRIIKAVSGNRIIIDRNFEIENYNFLLEFSAEEKLVQKQDDLARVKKLSLLLNKLSQKQKEVLYLKYFGKLNYFEIAEVMDINYQSVRNLTHKALKTLKTHFERVVS